MGKNELKFKLLWMLKMSGRLVETDSDEIGLIKLFSLIAILNNQICLRIRIRTLIYNTISIVYNLLKKYKGASGVCLGKVLSQSQRLLTRLTTTNFRLLIII